MSKFKITPFQFQANAMAEVFQYWDAGLQSLLLLSPPSSGKTVMASMIINHIKDNWGERGKLKIFFFVHLEDLKESTSKALGAFFEAKQVNEVNGKLRDSASIHICMIQTFNRRFDPQDWKDYLVPGTTSLCIFDECHRGDHDKVIRHLRETPELKPIKILGLTGTAKKPKGAKLPLSIAYDKMIRTVSEVELIKMKRTVPPYLIIPEGTEEDLDLNSVPKIANGVNAGEYNMGALSSHIRKKRYIYDNLVEILDNFNLRRMKMLVFCVDQEHCVDMTEYLIEHGIKAKFFSSGITKPIRSRYADDEAGQVKFDRKQEKYLRLANAERAMLTAPKKTLLNQWGRDFHALVNVNIFTTGFDDDSIQIVADAAPTMSENQYLQKEGRGKRIKEGKSHFYYIDLSESVKTFGHPCAAREYSLYESPRKKKKEKGEAPTKKCPQCGQSVPTSEVVCNSFTFVDFEPSGICGYEFPQRTRLERSTKFSLVKFDGILEMPAPVAAKEFKKSKNTTLSDVYEYFMSRWNSDNRLPYNWFLFTVFELFGVEGLMEFAETTNRKTDEFLERVQMVTNGRIQAIELARGIDPNLFED